VDVSDALDRAAVGRAPVGGWPRWLTDAPYSAAAHPGASDLPALVDGANCQRYAYALLELLGRDVPPHRSSELWGDPRFAHPTRSVAADLDLALFAPTASAWGAHVAVVVGERLVHLCAEVGRPAVWRWSDFAERERYAHAIGFVRVPPS
jgi:hypothetical protein